MDIIKTLPQLYGEAHKISSLDATSIEAMFTLFNKYYLNTTLESFQRDLSNKNWCILLYSVTAKTLQGFTTLHFYYNRLHTEKRLLFDKWWLDPDYTYGEATFMPRGMNATELTDSCYWARTQFNTHRSIAKRGIDLQANAYNFHNLTVYVSANLISRKEIHKKQGYILGANKTYIPDKVLP